MQGNIEKTAKDIDNYRKNTIFYESARKGFSEILRKIKIKYTNCILLLPGYIGYSPNEGSGIFDPVIQNQMTYQFYHIDKNINIDMEDYKQKVNNSNGKIIVLLVHYFGYIDPRIEEVVKIAKEKDAIIIEDCAHALYTDYIDGTCGKFSDISIYSLHKMLPYKNGGMIRINNNEIIELEKNDNYYNILEYDLKEIAKKRKRNAMIIEEELENVKGIKILRKTNIYENQTPQTYPILILEKDKNYFYHRLNNEGFGVVSLYHTMIKELQRDEYKLSTEIGMKILNLPVHQDANEDELRKMCEEIKQLLGEKHEQK